MVYVPLFQANILNYNEKMKVFHSVDMTTIIPQNFLMLSVSMRALDEAEIIATYPDAVASRFIETKNRIDDLAINNNEKFAIRIDHHFYVTKNREKATNVVRFEKEATDGITIVKELQDPNQTHKYTAKSCIKAIQERLRREGISVFYNGKVVPFTSFRLTNFCKYYGLKQNEKLCYIHKQYSTPIYTYSQQMIEFIVDEIRKDPIHILDNIKK